MRLLGFCLTIITLFSLSQDSALKPSSREAWSEKGFDLALVYTGEYVSSVQGGLNENSGYLDNIDLVLGLDGEKAFGWKGMEASLYFLYNAGYDPSADIGDAQVTSNIEASDTAKLYEAWIKQSFGDGASSLLLGLYDVNSEFDVIEAGGLFFNSSHGIGPDFSQSGLNGPSIFPTTSMALRYQFKKEEGLFWRAAILDAVPGDLENEEGTHINFGDGEGALLLGEIGWRASGTNGVRLALGSWFYTATFVALDAAGSTHKHNSGGYLLAEKIIANPGNRSLAAYFRYGVADKHVNEIANYTGFGLVFDEKLGLAFAHIEHQSGSGHETNIELSYRLELNPWFALQPDVQWIDDPGMNHRIKNALVFAVRFEISL